MSEKSLSDRLSSLEQEVIKKTVGGKVINTNKPMEIFEVDRQGNSNNQQYLNAKHFNEKKY